MKYISTLREGERINEIFLCKSKQTAMTKSGKPYHKLSGQFAVFHKACEKGERGRI